MMKFSIVLLLLVSFVSLSVCDTDSEADIMELDALSEVSEEAEDTSLVETESIRPLRVFRNPFQPARPAVTGKAVSPVGTPSQSQSYSLWRLRQRARAPAPAVRVTAPDSFDKLYQPNKVWKSDDRNGDEHRLRCYGGCGATRYNVGPTVAEQTF
eukprot:TRINITY_DN6012_c0_g1_i2.p1 TRINITY_DN6012_c0_g1~~TRINITY_DN6012_c0_g1_i2.p1  ORF type:complete len:155 (+),score=22.61 TRINITY_DN6012_c0_g1_i2:82-546(+)